MGCIGRIFKTFFFLFSVLAIVAAFYLTTITTEHREQVRDMRFNTSTIDARPTDEFVNLGGVDLKVSNVRARPINEDTEISEGDEYYVYYTLTINNNSESEAYYEDEVFGHVTSSDWEYLNYEVDEETPYSMLLLTSNGTHELDFRIKTDEPLSDIGYLIPHEITPDGDNLFIPFGE